MGSRALIAADEKLMVLKIWHLKKGIFLGEFSCKQTFLFWAKKKSLCVSLMFYKHVK